MPARKDAINICKHCGCEFEPASNSEQKYCCHECYVEHKHGSIRELTCSTCGEQYQGRGKYIPKYCSQDCYMEARRTGAYDGKVPVYCKACNKEMRKFPKDARRSTYHFCSQECKKVPCIPSDCVECGREFLSTIYSYRIAKFCSIDCRYARNRREEIHKRSARMALTCEQCGKEFYVRPAISKVQRYCSQKCSGVAVASRHTGENSPVWKPRISVICEACGKEFETFPSRKGRRKYCSVECRDYRVSVTCLNCGTAFDLQPSRAKDRVYCSAECQRIHQPQVSFADKRTSIEIAVADMLRSMRYKFIEQYPVGYYLCDLYVINHQLIIETDGDYWHSLPGAKLRDKRKDSYLHNRGYKILRLPENKINDDPKWCKAQIRKAISQKGTHDQKAFVFN